MQDQLYGKTTNFLIWQPEEEETWQNLTKFNQLMMLMCTVYYFLS